MECGYETVREEDNELNKILIRSCLPGRRSGYLRFGPEKVVLPHYYAEFKELIDNFEVRPDDTWVISYPKSGTTWTQEMVWCIATDLDYEGAKLCLPNRFPFLEVTSLFGGYKKNNSISHVAQLKSPRFIKTHLPWQMLPKQLQDNSKKAKIIYVARNSKDTCLSQYHFSITLGTFAGDFETFAKLFLGDTLVYTPFWSQVLTFWNRRNQENILFLKFEDMKRDLPSVILKTADFLGKTLTESQVRILADHLSFAKMKVNPAVNYDHDRRPGDTPFMRKGEIGQWKTDMSPELIEKFDKWNREHLEGTGLTF